MTINQACRFFGLTISGLAKMLGISKQAVYQWVRIPLIHQISLERLSKGELKADIVQLEHSHVLRVERSRYYARKRLSNKHRPK